MKGKRMTTWGFPEELKPCGTPGIKCYSHLPEERRDLSKILVSRPATHPWWIILWEPLTTKVPGPHLTQVWCCYAKTVIFYIRPYTLEQFHRRWLGNGWHISKPGHSYAQWAQMETAFRWDDVVEWEGECFKIGGGKILWANGQWWCRSSARRESKQQTA